jgi:tetratricopeptide (TPR) repeat protein
VSSTGPSTSAPDPSTRWLFGPTPDLLLGCGLGYAWVFLALAVLGTGFVEAIPLGLLPLVLLVTGTPHYGATLLRVYEQRDSRRAYAIFSVGVSAALAASYVGALHYWAFGSLLMTVYFNWNPWHYAGQNYGLAVMFLRRRGVPLSAGAKRLLYASFVLSALLAIVEMNGFVPGALYAPQAPASAAKSFGPVYEFVSIGLAPAVQRSLTTTGLAAYAASLVGALFLLLRAGAKWRDLGPSALLVGTQSLWFVIPGAARVWGLWAGLVPLGTAHFNYAFIWIAVGHAVQYLWITTYYARRTEGYPGLARYYAKCVLAGAVIWNFPALVFAPGMLGTVAYNDGLFLLTASVVNLHHFVLDGAIWKLRDSRIASVLVRATPSTPPPVTAHERRSWIKPLVWAGGVLCVAVVALGTWEREVGFRRAALRADYERIESAGRRLTWIGQQESSLHRHLGALSVARGNSETALDEYARSLDIRPHPRAHFERGAIFARGSDWEQAAAAYESAYALDPAPVSLITRLAEALVHAGQSARAAVVLREGLALHPRNPLLQERLRRLDAAGDA